MRITIVSRWYNEELFAPFFLAHYSYADRIHIFLDKDTNDDTRKICGQYDNVEIEETAYRRHKICAIYLIGKINKFVAELESDWVYHVDCDELIFPANGEEPRAVLARQTANLIYAGMWHSWKHKTEADLDLSKPSVFQRRHGTLLYKGDTYLFTKPIIVRPEIGIRWHAGQHSYRSSKQEIVISEEIFMGAHWKYADTGRAVAKRIERYDRRYNRRRGQEKYDRNSIKESMEKLAEKHSNDPQMF